MFYIQGIQNIIHNFVFLFYFFFLIFIEKLLKKIKIEKENTQGNKWQYKRKKL